MLSSINLQEKKYSSVLDRATMKTYFPCMETSILEQIREIIRKAKKDLNHITQEKDDQITYYSDNAAEYPPEVYSLNRHFLGEWEKAIVGRVLWGWTDLTRK